MPHIGYARVSTGDQSLDIQREQLKEAGCRHIFEEKVSGKDIVARDELKRALVFLAEGDTLVVTKLDRLARSTLDMLNIVGDLGKRGVKFKSLAEPWCDTTSAAGELMLTVFAGVAQFERGRIRERQLEGIARAKAAGKYKGGKPTARAKAGDVRALAAQGVGPSEIARQLKIGRTSVYRAMRITT